MFGAGLLRGMAITARHFVRTYLDDIFWMARGGRYYNDEALQVRQSLKGRGVITVFYPEEKLPVPDRFRRHCKGCPWARAPRSPRLQCA